MTRRLVLGLVVVLAVGGCAKRSEDSPMAGMTAEEHAKMQAGGTGGATDGVGMAQRQPVHLTAEQARALGVTYLTVARDTMSRDVRTVGQIVAPESTITSVTPKIEGFVEHLDVNYTGQLVRRGEPLLSLYSPMLVAAEQELLTAKRLAAQVDSGAGDAARYADEMLRAARRRLAYWDITPEQIARIERTGEVARTLALVAPFDGIVLAKDVVEGQRVMPGMQLYRLADLRTVWIEGDVFEQDLASVRLGSRAHFELDAYPGSHLMGRVSFVYPTVDPTTRTGRVRVTVPNPDLRLRPGMFATMYFEAPVGRDVLAVPREAVVMTGERNLVFVRGADGMLEPRDVVLGARSDERVQILRGLAAGETIVAAANFLVDAESRLAGGGGMPGMAGMDMSPPAGAAGPTGGAMPGMAGRGPAAARDTGMAGMPGMRHAPADTGMASMPGMTHAPASPVKPPSAP
jgi:Cu(I)/Ag(I) efflux system membrane fusion protein